MKVGIAADHGGFELKNIIRDYLVSLGHAVEDHGAYELNTSDDYPDFVLPLARSVSSKNIDKGIAICGSGVGASIAANKVKGVRAALVHDHFSAHQGVEDDDMNLLCLGGRIIGSEVAKEIVLRFLEAKFTHAERHLRRLNKVKALE